MLSDSASRRPTSEAVVFPSGESELEGVLHHPVRGEAPFSAAVVLQPHPLYGGDMHNNVVVALCRTLADEGFAALRFNFRSVGGRGGLRGSGIEEREDARAALAFLASCPGVDAGRFCLAGYSFGAVVALSLGELGLRALAAVSPPLGEGLSFRLTCPTLLVFGERDSIAPPRDQARLGLDLPEGSRALTIRGADHFWLGFEESLAGEVGYFFIGRTRPA